MITAKECLLWLGGYGNGYGYGYGNGDGNGYGDGDGYGNGYGYGNGNGYGDGYGDGDGDGYGYGYGYGYGDGNGYGDGDGYGYGDGYGNGYGDGDGYGYGNGYGYGYGNGDGYGYGDGYGNGNGDGDGYGNGYGYGYGDGYGNGYGDGDGYGNGYGYGYGYGNGNYCMPHPYYKVDGIWCKFISIHGNYARVEITDLYNADNCVAGYIAKDGDGNFAHGQKLRDARESLIYKIGMRDTSVYESWKLTDIKTKSELIRAYRVITGACEFGTRQFCNGRNLPDKATVKQAIEITSGQYGADRFKQFFNTKG